ncbi:MAG: carbon-nitrogen hydrolase family protein, partial [Eubacterium sp.]|nr:carbon-nitrogen hydrolase family protein [Eubacterium sp.]
DGVAYLPETVGGRDTCVLQADGSEGVFVAELDLEQLRRYRSSEVHGNAFRRPEKYSALTETKIDEPFIRCEKR